MDIQYYFDIIIQYRAKETAKTTILNYIIMQTIEFKTKNEAKKRAILLKNGYKTTKVEKTANNMYVVIYN